MDSYQGDLADIVRATAATTSTTINEQMQDWRFGSSNPDLYPFSDPLLHDMDQITGTGLPFTDMGLLQVPMSVPAPVQENINNYSILSRSIQIPSDSCNNSNSISNRNSDDNNNSRNNNINRVKLPVSPSRVIKPGYGLVTTEMLTVSPSVNGFKDGFIDNTTEVQIPSPRNPGIKRRKSQAKKVVCIPAPAAANSRQTGEVVPSDLWAWRKYGQKPIKGSPYPRGYYRCSSSKGCSARKQVERSRTDPNMLVITYTSEHNHPWPTQRNALAGSTRSQPSKINVGTASPKPFSSPHTQTATDESNNCNNNYNHNNDVLVKEELNNDQITSPESNNYYANSSTKDENVGTEYKVAENNRSGKDNLDPSDLPSYRPVIPEHSSQQSDQDFFADLVGFEGDDPLNLLFIQENKAFSPFSAGGIFDWGPPSSINATNNDLDKYSTIYNGQGEGKS